jgi:hypothetical protein
MSTVRIRPKGIESEMERALRRERAKRDQRARRKGRMNKEKRTMRRGQK